MHRIVDAMPCPGLRVIAAHDFDQTIRLGNLFEQAFALFPNFIAAVEFRCGCKSQVILLKRRSPKEYRNAFDSRLITSVTKK
jgi:hypothetical protein